MGAGLFFNDLEALKIAIDIEKTGEKFYIAAANRIDETDIKHMLLELADQERDHVETFENIYKQVIDKKEGFDDTYLYEPEISAYLLALVRSVVFPNEGDQERVIANINSVQDVLRLGIQAEKDSILFYTEMIIHSRLIEAKDAFRRLLGEEKKHLMELQVALQGLK